MPPQLPSRRRRRDPQTAPFGNWLAARIVSFLDQLREMGLRLKMSYWAPGDAFFQEIQWPVTIPDRSRKVAVASQSYLIQSVRVDPSIILCDRNNDQSIPIRARKRISPPLRVRFFCPCLIRVLVAPSHCSAPDDGPPLKIVVGKGQVIRGTHITGDTNSIIDRQFELTLSSYRVGSGYFGRFGG